jgi:hypothetical protein
MKFLELICVENDTTDEQNAIMRREIFPWVKDTVERKINITGKPLGSPDTAKTVRVRSGETVVSDGPFADTKEFIGGFDLLECRDMDEAIEVAAKHPVAWFQAIELRPIIDDRDVPPFIDSARLGQMLLVCVDGKAESPEIEDQIDRDVEAWVRETTAHGVRLAGAPLAGVEQAKTVRVRDGRTIVTNGPLLETEEFIGGFDLLACASLDEAVGWAAKHPIARLHRIEVREFVPLTGD